MVCAVMFLLFRTSQTLDNCQESKFSEGLFQTICLVLYELFGFAIPEEMSLPNQSTKFKMICPVNYYLICL